ncbi:MAG: holo-ACP synthase [Armatimonadota bacterium]
MYKIGMDIVEINRIKESIDKHKDQFLNRVFTSSELEYSRGKAGEAAHLAARFCGKEAVMKALSVPVDFKDIEIISGPEGAPFVKLHGRACELAGKNNVKNIQISLSHCKEYAAASVILEAG